MTFRRLGLICAMLAMFSIAGGHWAVLQSVAWAGMLRDYSAQTGSLLKGVAQTFDGQHLCDLCRLIDSAKAQEKAGSPAEKPSSIPAQSAEVAKTDKACAPEDFWSPARLAAADVHWPATPSSAAVLRAQEPPTPPPRFVG